MEEKKNTIEEGMTMEAMQQQSDTAQRCHVRDLNEEVKSLTDDLEKANKDVENYNRWWMAAIAERDEARQMLKSLKTIFAAIDVENLFR